MEEKTKATIGVFAAIMNGKGKVLLRRRTEIPSIIPGKSYKGCWELPGGGVRITDDMPYSHLVNELVREVAEEVGIVIIVDLMPPMYPVFFGKVQDLALVTPVVVDSSEPIEGETRWASLEEVDQLARDYKSANKETGEDGKGIVSGCGKRMHCMILKGMCFGPVSVVRTGARVELKEIQKYW